MNKQLYDSKFTSYYGQNKVEIYRAAGRSLKNL